MATVYKRSQDKGKKRACWYIGYQDHNGKRRTKKGFTDKGQSERLAVKLEEDARQIRAGLKEPTEEAFAEAKRTPIGEHLDAFKTHLRNKDVTEKQVSEVTRRIERVVNASGIGTIASFDAHEVESQLSLFRSEGMGKQTSNHYLRAMKQFTRWLVRTKRLSEDPLQSCSMLNVQTDRRHDRRALSSEEFALLLDATESGSIVESISGPDRAMMYVIASWTGYRKGEIGSLTKASFDLEADPPTVTVEAMYSKRKRTDTQVLHSLVVDRLRLWLAEKRELGRTDLLFSVSGKVPGGTERKTAKMMRHDLKKAREAWLAEEQISDEEREQRLASDFLKYQDSNGRFADFHANRHTFITNLSRAGVSAKTAQTLARHGRKKWFVFLCCCG